MCITCTYKVARACNVYALAGLEWKRASAISRSSAPEVQSIEEKLQNVGESRENGRWLEVILRNVCTCQYTFGMDVFLGPTSNAVACILQSLQNGLSLSPSVILPNASSSEIYISMLANMQTQKQTTTERPLCDIISGIRIGCVSVAYPFVHSVAAIRLCRNDGFIA